MHLGTLFAVLATLFLLGVTLCFKAILFVFVPCVCAHSHTQISRMDLSHHIPSCVLDFQTQSGRGQGQTPNKHLCRGTNFHRADDPRTASLREREGREIRRPTISDTALPGSDQQRAA